METETQLEGHSQASTTPVAANTTLNALVTGGAQGIGAATARKLASRGMNVLIADMSVEGKQLAQQIKDEYGVDAAYQYIDVRRGEDIDMMIKTFVSKWGRLDYAANVAGINLDGGELRDDETKVSQAVFDRAEAQQMASQEPRPVHVTPSTPKEIAYQRGSIVNISSTAALTTYGFPSYSATKAAVLAITRNGAVFYGKHGIRCNSVCPGFTATPMARPMYPDSLEDQVTTNGPEIATNVPLRKNAWPEETASVISFFLSDESSHVTGSNLEVDGGLSITGSSPF
ncbi:hypothetical protein M409DRAFT_23938 [Zasmidium cellare ATCC 36951]|uniref:Uncharacterized protein n=1 Tax=Zasmidium cellare ATCC 36951 TaxID=1080233 RepID=A0A6A6CHH4_ZASCE|nr:uncharacterized protein M409DRAFT_23938 [Zasmidium cellare ATCC 36951]KAF2165648.1 hypothetical protein M409DRAFT_23938 [Zasmidium cellare ATCC 36951]